MTPTTTTARATLLVVVAACCFGSISILTVLSRAQGAALVSILFWRYLIGSAGLFAVSGAPAVRLPRARLLPILLLGGAGQAIVTGTSLGSLEYIPAATLGFLFYTYPAWITVIAAVRGVEPLTPLRAIALVLSLTGIVLMIGNPFAGHLPIVGLALALTSALVYALYIPLLNRLGAGVTPAVTSAWLTLGTAIILGAFGIASGQLEAVSLTARAWAFIAILAIACTVVAFIVFLRGLATLGPVRTAIISTVEPFWTAILGAVVLAQPLTKGVLAGGACIAVAVALLQWKPANRSV